LLVRHKIKTWWVKTSNPPSEPSYDPIITNDVIINNLSNTGLEYARNVLHDGFTLGTLSFPATTPTATEYALGTASGTTVINLISISDPGSGYSVGGSIGFSGDGGTYSGTVQQVGVSNSITMINPSAGEFGWDEGTFGPYSSGSAEFTVFGITIPTYTPGTAWIGSERVVAASVSKEKELNVWKYQTESVVMQ